MGFYTGSCSYIVTFFNDLYLQIDEMDRKLSVRAVNGKMTTRRKQIYDNRLLFKEAVNLHNDTLVYDRFYMINLH